MFEIKRGDLMPLLAGTLTDKDTPVDLSTAVVVRVLGYKDGVLVINRSVTGSADGRFTMAWDPPDTATTGDILMEVEVTWPGAKPQTFPNGGYEVVRVVQDLG